MEKKQPSWFTAALLFTVSLFLIGTLGLTFRAKIIPLIVAIPTLALLLLQLSIEIVPHRPELLKKTEAFAGVKQRREKLMSVYQKTGAETDSKTGTKQSWAVGSLMALVTLVLLFGMIIGSAFYIAGVYRFVAHTGRVRAAVTALIVTGCCYALFVVMLNIPVWQGLLLR